MLKNLFKFIGFNRRQNGQKSFIRFKNPHKYKTHSGLESLELTDAGTWESFPLFGDRLVRQIGASIRKEVEGPDIHIWEIEYDGYLLNLVYDDYPNGISIEPNEPRDQEAINILYNLFKSQSHKSGL